MLQNFYEGISLLPLSSSVQCSSLPLGWGSAAGSSVEGRGPVLYTEALVGAGFLQQSLQVEPTMASGQFDRNVVRPDLSQCSGKMA